MANDLWLWGALGVGAFLLAGGMRPRQTASAMGGGGGGPAIDLGGIFRGLFAASGDEDIGIAPQGPLAAPGPATGTPVRVQDSNTPVIEQTPVLVSSAPPQTFTVQGTQSQGFSLLGPTEGLTGSTQIRVAEFVGFAEGETFQTTPSVLSSYLAQFAPQPTQFLRQPENVDLDIGI